MYDWNHNNKKDSQDTFFDYSLSNQTNNYNQNSCPSQNRHPILTIVIMLIIVFGLICFFAEHKDSDNSYENNYYSY